MADARPPQEIRNSDKNFRKKTNYFLGILVFIGITALILGLFQIIRGIRSPFEVATSDLESEVSFENDQLLSLAELKTKDTDEDGLTDYDELYQYETSPYLKDSDSDGFDDKQEIETQNDPNCPKDKNCTQPSSSETQPSNLNLGEVVPQNLTTEQLRETLKGAGAPESLLESVDDETLMQIYQESLAETGLTLENTNTANTNLGTTINLEALANLSPAEIRDFLKASGADEELLNSVDDDTLMTIFRQALEEQFGSLEE